MEIYELVIIGLMLSVNAVFAAFEMAMASVSHSRLVFLANQKKKGATAALHMKERMEASLAVVQLGITLAGAIAAATGGAAVDEKLAPYLQSLFGLSNRPAELIALIGFVIPLSIFTIVFAELVPKMFAIQNNEKVCLRLAPAMFHFSNLIYPLIRVFEGVVKAVMRTGQKFINKEEPENAASLHELNAAVSMARLSRLIGAQEERILLSAARLPTRPISEIMIPSHEITMLQHDSSLIDALLKAHLDLHTRFPVSLSESDPNSILGYVNFKDLVVALKFDPAHPSLKSIVRPLKRFPHKTSVASLLEIMMKEKVHIALVEGDKSEVLGMVTLEDVMEDLVGDIEDEFDRLPTHVHKTETGWIMGGGFPAAQLGSTLGVALPNADQGLTLASWADKELGRSVVKGETFQLHGLVVNVRKIRRRKIAECFISIASRP